MATFLNTVLSNVLQSLETKYNVYEVYDADDANVVLNDVQEASFPVAFFSIKNNGAITLTRHKKSYPVYDVAIWLLNLYREDDKAELETNYEGLRLDALEFLQRFQRTTAFSRVPTNTVLTPRVEEFDAQLDLLATAVQITFTASIDIEEDTSRVCAPLSISSFTLNDSNLDAVVLDASASSYRGTASGSTAGTHNWEFVMNGTSVSISGLATSALSASDIASLATIGMINATGTYNSFTFEKNPNKTAEFNYTISVSHTYDFRSNGESSPATTDVIDKRVILFIETNWSNADGNFVAVIVSTETVDLIVGNTTYTGNSFSINDAFFDGTDKTITLVANDYSLISNFDITAKLINTLDLAPLTGAQRIDVRQNAGLTGLLTASNNLGANDGLRANLCNLTGIQDFSNTLFTNTAFIDLTSNANLTGVEFSTGLGVNSISDFRIPNCNFSGRIDATNAIIQSFNAGAGNSGLTGIDLYSGAIVDGSGLIALGCNFTGLLDLSFLAISSLTVQNQSLTSVIISSFSKRMTTISLNGQNIRTIDFGGATFSGAGNLIQLQDLNGDSLMTSTQISQMAIDIDTRAIAGTGTIRFDGNNPSLNAGGIVAKDSLISKGYTVLFN